LTRPDREVAEAVPGGAVEIVDADQAGEEAASGSDQRPDESIDHPTKVMRIGTMMKQLLEELRSSELDEPSRDRLRDIYDTSIEELGSALSSDLREELGRLALPFSEELPSAAELQIAKAQLVGWLEGLVQGIQAMLFAQQMAAQEQLRSMRGQLGPGEPGRPQATPEARDRPGTYL